VPQARLGYRRDRGLGDDVTHGCGQPSVTAVITTHNRAQDVGSAIESVLRQEPPVVELFVCDDGSSDGTEERIRSWTVRESRVRYHRFDPARGGPGPGRNHAIANATGDWIAFLDDDDEWLPGKLAAQLPALASGRYDLVATNAQRTSGPVYFPALARDLEPARRSLLHVNPIIISSVVARRSLLQQVGGFSDIAWLRRGPLDYHTWLRLSDAGGRFLVLAAPLVLYDDAEEARLSSSPLRIQRDLLRITWSRWRADPRRLDALEAALRHTSDTAITAAQLAARRRRTPRAGC
jgi:glycosyltransferase involved in cell wall biosynthesis